MRKMRCKVQLSHPLMFAGKDAKEKKNNGSEWNVHHIVPHILTKEKNTHNNSLFCI